MADRSGRSNKRLQPGRTTGSVSSGPATTNVSDPDPSTRPLQLPVPTARATPEQADILIRGVGLFDTSVGTERVQNLYNSAEVLDMPLYYVPSPRVDLVTFVNTKLKSELERIQSLGTEAASTAYRTSLQLIPRTEFAKWFPRHHFLSKDPLEKVFTALLAVIRARLAVHEEELSLVEQEREFKNRAGVAGNAETLDDVDLESILNDTPATGEPAPVEELVLDTQVLEERSRAYETATSTLVRTVASYVRAETQLEDDFFDSERANVENHFLDSADLARPLTDELPLRTVAAMSRGSSGQQAAVLVESEMTEKEVGEHLSTLIKAHSCNQSAGGATKPSRRPLVFT